MDLISQLEKDIKNLKIQGATNIALTTLKGLSLAVEGLKKEDFPDPDKFLQKEVSRLAFARPTEPLAQNALRFIFSQKENNFEKYLQKAQQYKNMIGNSKYKMGEFGVNLIESGGVYLTHCHSSTVNNMLIAARNSGKKFRIIATETRPRYQGRLTVKELLDAGFDDITMIIDDAASSLLLENKININAVFIGADLLSDKGFVNKVGSQGIAYCAGKNKIPVYCMSILLKYDPRIFTDKLIESRNSSEIWDYAPSGLKFIAPAFDFIPYYENIYLITETGLLKGPAVKPKALELYSFLNSPLPVA